VAAVVLAWVANQRDLPGCRTEGFFETRDAISQLFYLATVSGVVAVVASIAATAFCTRLRSVFVLVLFVSLLLTAFCFIGAVGTGLSCALD
jgi:hypothetical protein